MDVASKDLATKDLARAELYDSDQRFHMWRELTTADAVLWTDPGESPGGFWSVFSHQACRQVLAPHGPFTSEHGMMIGFDKDHPDHAGGRMLVATDGSHHSYLRKLIAPFLSRSRSGPLTSVVEAEVDRLLAQARQARETDVAAQLAPQIPAAVVCEILGVPRGDRDHLIQLTNHAFGGAERAFDQLTPAEAHGEILYYFQRQIAERQQHPGADLISAMVLDGQLTPRDMLINCDNVLIGGNETTRHSATACFHAAATTPGLLEEISTMPDDIDSVVEELIRWSSPAMHVLRVASADFEVNGQKVQAGQPVVAWLPAANRDPRMFSEPDQVIGGRQPNQHIAFGHGLHHCLGAAMARLELKVLLRRMASQLRSVTLPEPPTWLRSNVIQGYLHLPAHLEWRN